MKWVEDQVSAWSVSFMVTGTVRRQVERVAVGTMETTKQTCNPTSQASASEISLTDDKIENRADDGKTGYRLIDIALLSSFLEENVVCKQCSNSRCISVRL